ncbi:MAG: magnesium transporter [Myxococcales bacterium]|nr:magnesium transporter [Myxococcales bacterium]MCB9521093.1 magnesium transporter [Myxococcales bacterium]
MSGQGHALLVDSIRKLLRRNAERNLGKIVRRTHAADLAAVLPELPERDRLKLIALIPDLEQKGEVLSEADPGIAGALLEQLPNDEIVEILKQMFGDDAADLVELLPEERASAILTSWQGDDATEVDTLLGYAPDTAGGIMSPDAFALQRSTTVREAIETLQASHEELEMAFYLYVVNEHGHLVGVISLRQLVVSSPDTLLDQIMVPEVVSVRTDTDQEDVARLVARYNFLAVPVVDASNRLVGVVTVDDIIDVIKEEATEDMLMMAGAGGDFHENVSPMASARLRMPWLLASFIGGLGSMTIVRHFESTLAQVAALAAFIPITLGMGGNVGTQAATLVTRGIALGKVNTSQFVQVVGREVATGVILGSLYGLGLALVASVAYADTPATAAWHTWQLAATVSLGIASCMSVAAIVGGAFPMLFERLGIDPAIAAGPFVTTTVDILGITVYFAIGRALLL